jgi:predicted  nucleic acid-binding Zn-ribbon protein
MNPYIEPMLLLQRRLQAGAGKEEIEKLRAQVPVVVLDHFDRMIAQGRKGVAEVHHGVCGACHLRLPSAVVVPCAEHEDLELCENCGAYLSFPAEETAMEKPVAKPRRRRAVATV